MNPVFHAAVAACLFETNEAGFIGGTVSHAIVDSLFAEWHPAITPDDPKTWLKYAGWLVWQVGGCIAIGLITNRWYAVLGGVFPDIVDGVWWLYNKLVKKIDTWQTGNHLCPWHRTTDNVLKLSPVSNTLLEIVMFAMILR